MKIGISPLTHTISNSPYKSKNQSIPFFSYDIPTEKAVQAADNSTVNINEEYEKFLSESSGIKAALSAVPTYSVSNSQAEYLSQKYDLNNMPQNSVQEREFINELVSMNIIGEKDARLFNFNCGGSVESVSSCVRLFRLVMSQFQCGRTAMLTPTTLLKGFYLSLKRRKISVLTTTTSASTLKMRKSAI